MDCLFKVRQQWEVRLRHVFHLASVPPLFSLQGHMPCADKKLVTQSSTMTLIWQPLLCLISESCLIQVTISSMSDVAVAYLTVYQRR